MRDLLQVFVFVCAACALFVHGQINSIPNERQTTFYLDRYSDCDGRTREVGKSTVFISGVSTEHQGQPVTSCSITLNTENVKEPYRFKLQFQAVRIGDEGVFFYVYDGEHNGRLLRAFSKHQQKPQDLVFDFTKGQLVTFRMTRGEFDRNYDIRLIVTPIASTTVECNYVSEYGCDQYGYDYRLIGTKEIAAIIAGCFVVVVIIVIVIVICCYRKQRGISQKWKQEKLGHVNTAASLHSLSGKVTHSKGADSTKPWTTDVSRNGFASIRRSPNLPRAKIARSQRTVASNSSMFDSNATLPIKKPLPPPHVNINPRGTSGRSGRRYRENYDRYDDEDDRSSEQSFSTATKNFSDKNYKPPTYREALRYDSESSADEHTFVGANDSQQQAVFVERIITPRANRKTSPQVLRAQRALPPPDQDMESDLIKPKKKASTSKAKMVDMGAGSEEESEEESEESDTDNESEEEEESEIEEEESEVELEKSDKHDQADTIYSQPNKLKNKEKNAPLAPPVPQAVGFRPPPPGPSQPQQFQGQPYPGHMPPGVHQPQPRYGYPGHAQAYPQGQPQYPQGQPQYPQGQFTTANQPRPSQPSSYHQANFSVPLQQQGAPTIPRYPAQDQPHRSRNRKNQSHKSNRDHQDQVQPSNPPVYSYLVNRGYKPVDGRYSPVSTSTGASNLSGDRNLLNEDSDFSANLGSGVELMKRKT